ncbi:MAG: TetR/AcrR family transcriptional regulator [Acidobacteriota bacterium]
MVQKKESGDTARPRGRPRAYEPAVALQRAMQAFWLKGYAGTSVDDLCEATGLNKPSLYAGLGDKHSLYLRALDAYLAQVGAGLTSALADPGLSLSESLDRVILQAVDLYEGGRGCFVVSTTPTVAWDDVAVRDRVARALTAQDAALAARFSQARQASQWQGQADPWVLGGLVSALLHSLSLRARAGSSRQELLDWARQSLRALLA